MMNKQDVYHDLLQRGLWHEITEHRAVYTMAGFEGIALPYPSGDAKNLFVRDRKNQRYWMLTVHGDQRVNLQAFRHAYNLPPLHFASGEELTALLGLIPGSVTPLGLLNDSSAQVVLYMDEAFLQPPGIIGVHPNDNTATVWLKTTDLIQLLRDHGSTVHLCSFASFMQPPV